MTPLALAAAIPSACRLRMNSHSFCATKDKICSTRSAMKVPIRSLPCRVSSSQRVPRLLLGADIYRADNIQRKQPQLHRQVRHSLQLLPQCTKRINTPRMIFTIIFPPLLCQTVVPSGKYSIMLCIRRRNARQVSSRLR